MALLTPGNEKTLLYMLFPTKLKVRNIAGNLSTRCM
jgi:hypothetical protein